MFSKATIPDVQADMQIQEHAELSSMIERERECSGINIEDRETNLLI